MADGNMTCRSTSTVPSQSCWNGNTGIQVLINDAERRLSQWQGSSSNPTSSATSIRL